MVSLVHQFSSGIADDPADALAGKVLPSHWNAEHTLSLAATSRIVCRKTAGAGAAEEGTTSEVLDFLGTPARGDVIYKGASVWSLLPAGTSGQFLKTQGAGADPTWADLPATSAEFQDSTFRVYDNGDNTKKVALECSGITTATTRTYTAPNADGTLLLAYTPITASLGADVALNNTANYFDGPSIVQGSTGTWFVSGTVTLEAVSGGGGLTNKWDIKLWDGTTVVASAGYLNPSDNHRFVVALSGYLATPAGDLRISVKNETNTSAKILYNYSGNSKDSTISAFRIA